MKPDETALLAAMKRALKVDIAFRPRPRDLGPLLGIPAKRVDYICGKWADKGFYTFGVAVDLGWLIDYDEKVTIP